MPRLPILVPNPQFPVNDQAKIEVSNPQFGGQTHRGASGVLFTGSTRLQDPPRPRREKITFLELNSAGRGNLDLTHTPTVPVIVSWLMQ